MTKSNIEVEIELKSKPEIFWRNLKEFTTFFPKAKPDLFVGMQVLQGDGRSAGTVFLTTIKSDPKSSVTSTAKERIESVDEEKKILCYSILEGEMLKYYKNFKNTVYVSPKGVGSLVKYSSEFEKINEESPDPHFVMDFAVKLYHDLDAFLLNAQ